MNTNIIMLIIAILALVIGSGGTWLLTKSGKNTSAILNTADTVVDGLKTANDTLGKLLPSPVEVIIDKVLQTAQAGVHAAQQLYDSSQLSEDERKQKAFETAMNLLKLEGYVPTPELEAAVRDAIETGVFVMKNITGSEVKADAPVTTESAPAETVTPDTAADVTAEPKPITQVIADTLDQVGEQAKTQARNDLTEKLTAVVQGAVQSSVVDPVPAPAPVPSPEPMPAPTTAQATE